MFFENVLPEEACTSSGVQTTCSCAPKHVWFSKSSSHAIQAMVRFRTFVSAAFYRFWLRSENKSASNEIVLLIECWWIKENWNICVRALCDAACSFFILPLDSVCMQGQSCAYLHKFLGLSRWSPHFAWECSCALIAHRSVRMTRLINEAPGF